MNYRCDAFARNGLFLYFLELAEESLARGDLPRARFCAWKSLAGRPIRRSAYARLFRVWRGLARGFARNTLTPSGLVRR